MMLPTGIKLGPYEIAAPLGAGPDGTLSLRYYTRITLPCQHGPQTRLATLYLKFS